MSRSRTPGARAWRPGAAWPGKPNDKGSGCGTWGSCLDRRDHATHAALAHGRDPPAQPEARAGGCGAPAARGDCCWCSARPSCAASPRRASGPLGSSGPTAAQPNPAVFIFEHKAQHISRFIHNNQDLTYFAHPSIKAQPDDPGRRWPATFPALQTPIRQDRAAPRPREGRHTREWRGSGAPVPHVKDRLRPRRCWRAPSTWRT